jgi:hypothetical protein
MKVTESTINVQSSGIQSESFFNVKESNVGHIFSILRNKLYSNKPLAIIREYSTNAFDAHVEAGIPERPIEVSFPTAFKNSLTIRDFGLGLSENDVYNVFASYGESTKRSTNDQVGMMGLGSKSAFCYVNDFTITSYHDGKKSTYLAYIDETNIGKISKIAEEPTSETGLAIDVVVKTIDLRSFRETAGEFLAEFEPQPIIRNDDNVVRMMADKKNESYALKTAEYAIKANSRYNQTNYVRMGNVDYPFKYDDVKDSISSDLTYELSCFEYLSAKLFAPIGSVVPSASRESLEMNDQSKSFIINSYINILNKVKQDVQVKFDACVSLYDFWKEFRVGSDLMKLFNIIPTYKGVKYNINKDSILLAKNYPEILSIKNIEDDNRKSFKNAVCVVPHKNQTIFTFCNDVSKNSIRKRIMDSGYNLFHAFILEFKNDADENCIVNHPDWQGANFVNVADLNYTKASSKSVGAFTKSEVYRYAGHRSTLRDTWIADNLSLHESEGVYVEIKRFLPVLQTPNGETHNTVSKLDDILLYARNLGVNIPTLYGVKYCDIENLGDGWTEITDYIQQAFYNMTDENIERINRGVISSQISSKWFEAFQFGMIDCDQDMTRLKEIITKYYNGFSYTAHEGERVQFFLNQGFELYLDTAIECKLLIEKTLNKHPILKCLFGYNLPNQYKADDINDYWKNVNNYIKANDYLISEGLGW